MAQKKETAVVYSQEELAPGIFSMWIVTDIADEARPGQFISVYSQDGSRLLPRPISICEADPDEGRLRIVYRIAGKGTDEFSKYVSGDPIDIMGPLGNGFPRSMRQKRESSAIFPWRRRWHVESAPVWHVSASRRM